MLTACYILLGDLAEFEMTALKETKVRRGGVTARHWYETIHTVAATASSELRISFSMDSKGGGRTQVQMEIGPQDFPTLLEMMSLVNRDAAMKAMSVEMARQIETQSERDARAVEAASRKARTEIQQAAMRKQFSKGFLKNEQERVVHSGVKEIIAEIEAKLKT
jgi:hypothetical protein